MAMSGKSSSPYLKWYFILLYLTVPAVILLALYSDVLDTDQPGQVPPILWLLAGVTLLIAVIAMLAKIIKLSDQAEKNSVKLEGIIRTQEKNTDAITQISQNMCLSEAARTFIYREDDSRAIRQVIFNKLQEKDFEAANKLIDELAATDNYKELAEQLRDEANNFQDSGDSERENQLIANIDKLLDAHQWAKASVQIESLIQSFPKSDKAKQMRQKLVDKKEERKKVLLTLWDNAVKRQATDRSLEILRELDMYLTPNEGLALQEAARDVFRNKLHNIGVQFSIAVSGRQWQKAMDIGRQIVREFPNSKMAQEIRERLDVLQERVKENSQPAKKS